MDVHFLSLYSKSTQTSLHIAKFWVSNNLLVTLHKVYLIFTETIMPVFAN